MKIIFVRHGEPDKSQIDERGFIGQGRDMAPLTELGIQQAEEVCEVEYSKDFQCFGWV